MRDVQPPPEFGHQMQLHELTRQWVPIGLKVLVNESSARGWLEPPPSRSVGEAPAWLFSRDFKGRACRPFCQKRPRMMDDERGTHVQSEFILRK